MRKFLLFTLLLLISCKKCHTKYEVLQQRKEEKDVIIKKHGDIIPPLIDDVPDMQECENTK